MTPQWLTTGRKAKLVELRQRYGGLCLKGHRFCSVENHYVWMTQRLEPMAVPVEHPVLDKATGGIRRDVTVPGWKSEQVTVWEWALANLADAEIQEAKAQWKADDREERALDWEREQQAILDGTYGSYGSRFDPVARDVFVAQRPEYYLKAEGMDLVHFRPVALVRVPSTSVHLYVDVSAAFVKSTKSTSNQRRLARRRGKPIQEVTVTVEDLCQEAVRLWWNKRS